MSKEDKNTLLNDTRGIKSIWSSGPEVWGYAIQKLGCAVVVDEIECYGEPGEYCYIPWLRIWKDGKVIERINSHTISEVQYF